MSLNKTFKAFTARIGLRVEHTSVDGDFTSTSTVVQQQYTSFIPNLLLTKTVQQNHELQPDI